MERAVQRDEWDSGEQYEAYVGRWSRLVARRFVRWLDVPAGRRWLDVGCGTGALSRSIVEHGAPERVVGIDPSETYVTLARVLEAKAEFRVGDARQIPFADGVFDSVVCGLVLNFVPEPQRAMKEMARVTSGQGLVSGYVWDYGDKMEMMRYFWDAAAALDSRAKELDEGQRFPICRPEQLANLFEGAGLSDVATRAIDVDTLFRDFGDYWSPFLGGQGPAPGYVTSLSEERREVLRRRLEETLPRQEDGTIKLTARAWAVRGAKPGGVR